MAPVAPPLQRPPARTAASGRSRTGSLIACDRTRSATHAPPSGGVVIDDGAMCACSAPARRTTRSVQRLHLKEEDATCTPPLPLMKEEMVGDGGGDAGGSPWRRRPGRIPVAKLHRRPLCRGDYQQMTMDLRQAAVWSARDHGANFIDLAGPSEPPAPKEEEDDDWFFGSSSDDDGDSANNLDFSAFDAHRR
ncbi:hypothetical protein QYE76_033870 [Lolium multiflorum]|uniref:Uncharacterized protein n=1 Tax=Lolium multiflorum TaxID=4521 RepID=A0AAD8QY72_LOLMU|nr:hypothetical protein QYE76_033870 [Lolium multiflorum]